MSTATWANGSSGVLIGNLVQGIVPFVVGSGIGAFAGGAFAILGAPVGGFTALASPVEVALGSAIGAIGGVIGLPVGLELAQPAFDLVYFATGAIVGKIIGRNSNDMMILPLFLQGYNKNASDYRNMMFGAMAVKSALAPLSLVPMIGNVVSGGVIVQQGLGSNIGLYAGRMIGAR